MDQPFTDQSITDQLNSFRLNKITFSNIPVCGVFVGIHCSKDDQRSDSEWDMGRPAKLSLSYKLDESPRENL